MADAPSRESSASIDSLRSARESRLMYTQSTFCFLLAHGAPSATPSCTSCQVSSETTEGRPGGNDSYSAAVWVFARLAVDGLMRMLCVIANVVERAVGRNRASVRLEGKRRNGSGGNYGQTAVQTNTSNYGTSEQGHC